MRHVALPALASDNEPRIESVTNKKLYAKAADTDPRKKDGVKFSIPAEQFEYPQFDSIEEFINDAGSAEKALARINDATCDRAVSTGKNYIRTASTGTEQEIVAKGLALAKAFSWSKVDSSVSAATVKNVITDARAKFKAGEISADELVKMVMALEV